MWLQYLGDRVFADLLNLLVLGTVQMILLSHWDISENRERYLERMLLLLYFDCQHCSVLLDSIWGKDLEGVILLEFLG
ncbi:MAG: hypothetical protein ACK5XR_08015 [Pseudanabaena sp.]